MSVFQRWQNTVTELIDEKTRLEYVVALTLKAEKLSSSQWKWRSMSEKASVLPVWSEPILLTWQENTVFRKMDTLALMEFYPGE